MPDIAVIRWKNLPIDEDGEIANNFNQSPDWIIEILSPDQSFTLLMEKIIFCLKNGTELGWLIDPGSKSITVFTSGLPKVYLAEAEIQELLTVFEEIKDWQITAIDIFNWLKV